MVKRNFKAFSLAEMMISMMIIMLVSVAAIPVVTQKKPDIKEISIRGQYACWRDNSDQLYELRCDERACRVGHGTDKCSLQLDNRPAHFLVFAVGSSAQVGTHPIPGQIVSDDNPSLASKLEINIPCITCSGTARDEGPTTITSSTASTEYTAASGAKIRQTSPNNSNGLVLSNVKRCNLLTAGQSCPNDHGTQQSCSIVNNVTTNTTRVIINGCTGENLIGETEDQFYDVSDFTRVNSKVYSADSNDVRVSFDWHDSMYTLKDFLPVANNASDGENIIEKILSYIPADRHSTLITTLKQHFDGDGVKNGAVLILW